MEQPAGPHLNVTSDLPQTDPEHDALGYAPFAYTITRAIKETPSPQGLVLAVHGPWGAGKTTLLNFIKHYLSEVPEGERPIVVDFNPWWFTSKEHLAQQFLANLRSKLVNESVTIRKAGDLLGEYAGAIGKAVGLANTAPWVAKPVESVLKLFKRKQKTVPELKAEISAKLRNGPRIVVFVDDIDRLVPEEVCELFNVVKAIADFPNVIYVLSLDREVVANALNVSLRIDGEAYLEKIIQAPFTLPAVDRILLRKMFFAELDAILESCPALVFDSTHWANVYFEGLDHYIAKPRDLVRVVNVLRVTYPAVAGEVNATDFIALEMLRIFDPKVYSIIRDNRDMFLKQVGSESYEKEARKAFHTPWLEQVPEVRREKVRKLIVRLFPHLAAVFGSWRTGKGQWRKDLRVSAPEIFDVYFQFGTTPQTVSRAEIEVLVSLAGEPDKRSLVCTMLRAAAAIRRGDGSSKVGELLERLDDLSEDLPSNSAVGLLGAIFDVGDSLLTSEDESGFKVPNLLRMRWAVESLLKRVGADKGRVLVDVIAGGKALGVMTFVIDTITDPECSPESPLANIDEAVLRELQDIFCEKLAALKPLELLGLPDFAIVMDRWHKWVGDDSVRGRLQLIWESQETLPLFLEKYVHYSTQWSGANVVAKKVPRLNLSSLEPVVPLDQLEPRVKELLSTPPLTESQHAAVTLFLEGVDRIRERKSPHLAAEHPSTQSSNHSDA